MKSSRELVASAERALRSGQPNLARLYMGAADIARERERTEAAMCVETGAQAVMFAERTVHELSTVLAPLYGVGAA